MEVGERERAKAKRAAMKCSPMGHHNHEVPAAIVVCTRPKQDQASQHGSLDRGGSHETPPLSEELRASGNC